MKKAAGMLYEFVSSLMTAILLITFIFVFIFRIVGVSGKSMEPTLHDKDWLVISAPRQEYEYGDIVIVVEPNSLQEPIVKRVIATGGQYLDIDFDNGDVYVGDSLDDMKKLNENYIAEKIAQRNYDDAHEYPVLVPEGKLFCMGDNRNNSTDSRSFMVDVIDANYVLGKSLVRIIPFGSWDIYASFK